MRDRIRWSVINAFGEWYRNGTRNRWLFHLFWQMRQIDASQTLRLTIYNVDIRALTWKHFFPQLALWMSIAPCLSFRKPKCAIESDFGSKPRIKYYWKCRFCYMTKEPTMSWSNSGSTSMKGMLNWHSAFADCISASTSIGINNHINRELDCGVDLASGSDAMPLRYLLIWLPLTLCTFLFLKSAYD